MTLPSHDIDRPEVLAEIRRVFDDYERALMANDVDALNAYFWADPRTTRYGITDRTLFGHEVLEASWDDDAQRWGTHAGSPGGAALSSAW